MSESAAELDGGTGEVTDASTETAEHPEDADAEQQLYQVMQEQDPEELSKQLKHWQKMAQRHERTARDNSAAATRLRELEDANKTELQKAVDAQTRAEQERDALRSAQSRMLAAAAHDLTPDLIDYLGDGTPDEIDERAGQLAGIIDAAVQKRVEQLTGQTGTRAPSGARRNRPVESLRIGAAPSSTAPATKEDAFRQLLSGNQD